MKRLEWLLAVWMGVAGFSAPLVGGCTKTYTQPELRVMETRELGDEQKEEREEDDTDRRVEEEGGSTAATIRREADVVDEEVTNDP